MTNYYWILDAGHGYDTPGKRSPKWPDGTQLFEYQFNRNVVGFVIGILASKRKTNFTSLVKEINDIRLGIRCRRAREIAESMPEHQCMLISFHGNAASVESASGFEVFTDHGQNESDKLATAIYDAVEAHEQFEDYKFRQDLSDGDPDKEARFYIIRKDNLQTTVGIGYIPACLVEFGFYTNEQQCKLMMSEQYQRNCAEAIVNAIEQIEAN